MRVEALDSYRALPLPDTTEEHWRFTDLKEFDPDSFGHDRGTVPESSPGETMLELDVAGLATITEGGIQIERAPEAITFAPLTGISIPWLRFMPWTSTDLGQTLCGGWMWINRPLL